MNLSDVTAFS